METVVLGLAMLVLAVALAGVGLAGITGRLPRNAWIGLRAGSLRKDDEAWRVGHRAAGGTLVVAAGPPLLLAAALMSMPPDALEDWLLGYAVTGVVTGGLIALASRRAQQAVEEVPTDDR